MSVKESKKAGVGDGGAEARPLDGGVEPGIFGIGDKWAEADR